MKITADHSGLHRRHVSINRALPIAARAAVVAGADAVVDAIERTGPRDTNRYVRGWQESAIKAGGKPRMVLPVVEGRFATFQIGQLEKQVRRIEGQIRWRSERFERWSKGRDGRPRKLSKWMHAERRRIYSLVNLLERAKEHLRLAMGSDSFVLIGRGYGRRISTVRTKVYGGTGRVRFTGGAAKIELRNREPHVRIVESRQASLARAVASAMPGEVADRVFAAEMRRLAGGVQGLRAA